MNSQWQLQPIFGSPLLAAALAAGLFGLLFFRPTFGNLTTAQKRTLIIIRSLIAALLCIAMLRPTFVLTEKQTQTAEVSVLFDVSRSMTHRDGEDGKTRWEQQLALLRSAIPKLKDLGDNFRVELVGFADQTQPQDKTDNKLAVTSKPEGEETDIGQALSDTMQRHVGKRIAAVILMSDGAQRALSPKIPPQQAARQLDRMATPLYTITLGESRDQSQSRDVAIENLQDEYSVFVKNEFALRVGVRIQGYVNQPIPVSVIVESDDGETKTLGPVELVATQDSQIVMGNFSFRPERAGDYKLRVRAEGQSGELIDNNEQTAFLNVREGGLRVLLLTSALLGKEQKFIQRSLDESQDIELDVHYESVTRRATWPRDLEEARVQLEDYDVFLIGDVDARAFRPGNWARIRELVEKGRGLMMFGGRHSFGPGGYAENALSQVLPIEMGQYEGEPDPTRYTRTDRHIDRELQMLPTTDSSITFLAPDDQNLAAWKSLKPLDRANRFDKLKRNAKVLAESANGDPLLVEGIYLGGRVLALATDSTYRWWRYGKKAAHKKFWRQAILWLARRDKQQANSVFIELPQRRFVSRTKVLFQTGLTDELGDVVVDSTLRATLTKPDGSTETVQLSASDSEAVGQISNALVGSVIDTEEAGDYRLLVEALDGDQVIASKSKEFAVEKKDFELGDPAANPGLLEMLSRITERAGGRSIAPEQLSSLIDEIKASPPKSEIETQSKWQLGDTAVDAWSYFGVLVILLTVEWFLRKRWGMI